MMGLNDSNNNINGGLVVFYDDDLSRFFTLHYYCCCMLYMRINQCMHQYERKLIIPTITTCHYNRDKVATLVEKVLVSVAKATYKEA